jgi:hypothetical protein
MGTAAYSVEINGLPSRSLLMGLLNVCARIFSFAALSWCRFYTSDLIVEPRGGWLFHGLGEDCYMSLVGSKERNVAVLGHLEWCNTHLPNVY